MLSDFKKLETGKSEVEPERGSASGTERRYILKSSKLPQNDGYGLTKANGQNTNLAPQLMSAFRRLSESGLREGEP